MALPIACWAPAQSSPVSTQYQLVSTSINLYQVQCFSCTIFLQISVGFSNHPMTFLSLMLFVCGAFCLLLASYSSASKMLKCCCLLPSPTGLFGFWFAAAFANVGHAGHRQFTTDCGLQFTRQPDGQWWEARICRFMGLHCFLQQQWRSEDEGGEGGRQGCHQ